MSNYSQYKITPDKNAAVDLSQTKVRIKASPSFHLAKKKTQKLHTSFLQDSRIEWNNNNDVPGALRSEAAQWSDWLERFTAAYLGPSVSAYFSYYPFLNNSRFRFFKRTENVGVLDLWFKYIYVTAPCCVVGSRVSFWFSPSNFGPVSVFPVADGWKVLCWFSTEQEMCFHSSAISETGDLFRSVFEMCVLKMPSWNKAEKSFRTVRQLLRTDLRSTRILNTQGTFTAVAMVTVSGECVSIVWEKACRLVLASLLPVTASRVTPTNSTCFTFLKENFSCSGWNQAAAAAAPSLLK